MSLRPQHHLRQSARAIDQILLSVTIQTSDAIAADALSFIVSDGAIDDVDANDVSTNGTSDANAVALNVDEHDVRIYGVTNDVAYDNKLKQLEKY